MARIRRDTLERLLRGGIGSSLVHGALALLLWLPAFPGTSNRSASPASALLVVQAAAPAPTTPGPRRDPDLPFRDQQRDDPPGEIPLSIGNGPNGADFVIDLARIRERRNDLFPFVTWDLTFLSNAPRRDGRTLEFRTDAGPIPPPGGPPLVLSADARQQLVDRAWSRRHRWSNLQELLGLAERYNPDRGDLPALFRDYLRQDVPQPYEDWTDADPVFWITLMLAADDGPLVEYVARYLRRHPRSRMATELLFLLDVSAESSCDVLLRVLRAGTAELPLSVTRFDNPDAFDLAASLATAYRGWVRRHRADVPGRCADARIAILRRIIDTAPADGYGAADARFRLGQLLWTVRRRREAVEWWSGMTADVRGQYADAQRALAGAIEDGAAESNPGRITNILIDEEQRWRAAAGARLDRFGVLATEF